MSESDSSGQPSVPPAEFIFRHKWGAGGLAGSISAHLIGAASAAAQQTLRRFNGGEPGDDLAAVTMSGVTVELIAKAVLASISPALIVDDRRDVRQTGILYLSGAGKLTKDDPGKIRTIFGEEAVTAAVTLYKQFSSVCEGAGAVIAARNSAVHLGQLSDRPLRVVAAMGRYVDVALPLLAQTRDVFWSAEYVTLIDALVAEAGSEVQASLLAKLAAAKDFYQQLIDGLKDEQRDGMLRLLAQRIVATDAADFDEPQTCPACGQQGICQYVRITETVDTGMGTYEMPTYDASLVEFACPVCSLTLDYEEAALAGLPLTTQYVDEQDYEPDEDHWRDR